MCQTRTDRTQQLSRWSGGVGGKEASSSRLRFDASSWPDCGVEFVSAG